MSVEAVPEVPEVLPPILRLSLEIVGTPVDLATAWEYITDFVDPDIREMTPGFSLRAGSLSFDVSLVKEAPVDD